MNCENDSTTEPLLSDDEEAELLKNLLSDDDDWKSRRLLELHYKRLNRGD